MNRAAIVTGATRGIGRGIALDLAGRGYAVAIIGRDATRAEHVLAQIRSCGADGCFVAADLTHHALLPSVIERASEMLGRLDVLVNNAASVGSIKPVLELTLDEWREPIDTNLTATFLTSQAAARRMLAQGTGGAIVNLLAIQSQLPIRGYAAYCASKGGLDALTRALAVELAPHAIRVNGLVVGSVYSESVRAILPDELAASEDLEEVPSLLDAQAATLIGRMGRPSDVARVVAFLASEDAAYLTGSIVVADGGRLLSRQADPLVPRSVSGSHA
jgi:NAD(P)-dependent dehydrogenase (short-subunit alcohol dehydrogenase family)